MTQYILASESVFQHDTIYTS